MSNAQNVLNVEKSLNNKKWVFKTADDSKVTQLCQSKEIPEFIARMLVQRGVDVNDIDGYLNPTLRNNFPDPFLMKGMKEFADDIAQCVIDKKPIGIFADFDVDGATSAAIMTRFLKHFDIYAPVHIPDRLTEGYGPSVKSMQSLKDQGVEYVLMLDCGTTAFEPLQAAHDMGLKVAIFDHHEAEEELPIAAHIINPKRVDDDSALDMLAACGVTFMACVAMNTTLRLKEYYKTSGKKEPSLKNWLDLVALGTVCDMVPLQGVNRLFVKAGFEHMAKYTNPGIKALLQVGKIDTLPAPKDAGWSMGPRINAGSRVHRSDLGAKLLSTDDEEEAQSLAWALEDVLEGRGSGRSVKGINMADIFISARNEGVIVGRF